MEVISELTKQVWIPPPLQKNVGKGYSFFVGKFTPPTHTHWGDMFQKLIFLFKTPRESTVLEEYVFLVPKKLIFSK